MKPDCVVQSCQEDYCFEIVKMWRTSFFQAMGLEENNQLSEVRGQLDYLRTSTELSKIKVTIDRKTSVIAGFMVLEDHHIRDLYIRVDYQRLGLGTELLIVAKQTFPDYLSLHTFEQNKGAQAFYQRHGFQITGRGVADLSNNPWASDTSQLRDIEFTWKS